MDLIAQNYQFLLQLVAAPQKKQLKLLNTATPQEIQAVVDCVRLCTTNQVPGITNIRGKLRWKRAVYILKRNRTLLKPALLAVLIGIVREAVHFVYDMS